MRVVFVDNLLFEDSEGIRRYVLQPHLGLISLIAILESAGHEGLLLDPKVEVSRGALRLDESLYHDLAKRVLRMEPDAVGMTSLGCNFICTVKIARYLKRWQPDLPVLLGGPHATVLDREILERFDEFDIIVRNEGEQTLVPVLDALPSRSFERLQGITFRAGTEILRNPGAPLAEDVDRLPFPAYHCYPVRELKLTSLRVEAGRGCPFDCTFCSTASFFGRQYRVKSAARLVRELDILHRTYGVSDFALTHDLFTVNRRKVVEFCEAVEGRGYTWKCSARMDCVDDELLERMSSAGCSSIYYGIETGSARMQRISKKRLDLGIFDPTLRSTQESGMSATVSFITGYPEETVVDQSATLDLIGTCFNRGDTLLNVQLHLLTPEPGTALLNQYRDRIAYDGHISDFNFPTLEPDDGEIIEGRPDVFINHHYFPSVIQRRRHVFVTTAYQSLYTLGFSTLRYILRRFDGRLNRLIGSMYRWAELKGRPPVCGHDAVESFLGDRFGASHHLVGLVRYMLAAAELRRRAQRESEPKGHEHLQVKGGYSLSSRARVVRSVPDCPSLLEHLDERVDALLPRGLLRRRHDFLLHLADGRDETVRNYSLTAPSAVLLEYLSGAETSLERFERQTGLPVPPVAFLDALAERGILHAASST